MGKNKLQYMLDTSTCIYGMKGRPDVLEEIVKHDPSELCISAATQAELMYGAEKSEYTEKTKQKITDFLTGIKILEFTAETAEEYGRIRAQLERRGEVIGPMDLIIAAHASKTNLTLVTHNTREFERVWGLKVIDWAQDSVKS